AAHVAAEASDHLAVLGDRAHEEAGARSREEKPERQTDGTAGSDEEEPIARIESAAELDGTLEEEGRIDRPRGHAIEDAHALLQDQREAKGEEELVDRRPAVDEAEGRRLQRRTDQPDDRGRKNEGEPEAAREADKRGRDVRAEHVEDAVSEVDDAQDAEDEREPNRDEEEERGERGRVEELLHDDGGRHRRSPRSEATLREVLSSALRRHLVSGIGCQDLRAQV